MTGRNGNRPAGRDIEAGPDTRLQHRPAAGEHGDHALDFADVGVVQDVGRQVDGEQATSLVITHGRSASLGLGNAAIVPDVWRLYKRPGSSGDSRLLGRFI